MSLLLKAAEWPYVRINRLRRSLYRAGVLKSRRLPKPVISVGNITAGGAGKTPAVIAIAEFLTARGFAVAVLTRGHGKRGAGGRIDALDPARFGDEPVLIKKRIPGVEVIVGANRYENGLSINCDVYLLDDGFQHLQLDRDLDIVIDAPNASFHREERSALRDADIIIPRRIRPAGLDALRGRRVFAFAGLADNEQFFAMLRDAGVALAGTRGFTDHHRYSAADIDRIRSADADVIVTTEKDAVKIGGHDIIPIAIEFEIEPSVLEQIAVVVQSKLGGGSPSQHGRKTGGEDGTAVSPSDL